MRRYWLNLLVQGLSLFMVFLPLVLNNLYVKKQWLYILESNGFKSEPHQRLNPTEKPDWLDWVSKDDRQVWVSAEIQQEDLTIYPIFANRWQGLEFPIYEGQLFNGNNQNEALVGSKIPIEEISGKEYFRLGDVLYQVIGRLGQEEESLLANTVLLNDSTLLEQSDTLFLSSFEATREAGVAGDSKGVARLLNLADFMKVMAWTSQLISFLTFALWLYFYSLNRRRYRLIVHQLGLCTRTIFKQELLRLLAIFSAILVLLAGLSAYLGILPRLIKLYPFFLLEFALIVLYEGNRLKKGDLDEH